MALKDFIKQVLARRNANTPDDSVSNMFPALADNLRYVPPPEDNKYELAIINKTIQDVNKRINSSPAWEQYYSPYLTRTTLGQPKIKVKPLTDAGAQYNGTKDTITFKAIKGLIDPQIMGSNDDDTIRWTRNAAAHEYSHHLNSRLEEANYSGWRRLGNAYLEMFPMVQGDKYYADTYKPVNLKYLPSLVANEGLAQAAGLKQVLITILGDQFSDMTPHELFAWIRTLNKNTSGYDLYKTFNIDESMYDKDFILNEDGEEQMRRIKYVMENLVVKDDTAKNGMENLFGYQQESAFA